MNLMSGFLSLAFILDLIRRGFSKPVLCKNGKFYEGNVFDYLECSLCTDKAHYQNCKTCCGSETATTSSANSTTAIRPEPVLNSLCGVEFFFQGPTLIASVIAFISGIIFTLIIQGIVKLVKRYRKKSTSIDKRKPPIEESRADVNSSTFVGLSVAQSDHDTN